MNSIVAVAVLSLAAAVQAGFEDVETIIDTPGEQYKLYTNLVEKVALPGNAEKDVFKGLDIARGNQFIDDKDLDLFYWHPQLKFAKHRFYRLFDDVKDNKVSETELKNDMKLEHIKMALIECTYLLSPGLRQSCYADQLVTYAALCLGENDITFFFNTLNKVEPAKNQITRDELNKIELPGGEHGKDLDILYEELGGNDGDKISLSDFTKYVKQETINDDFRECRKTGPVDVATGNVIFDYTCLQKELVEYANDDLTEMDIAVLFRAVDTSGNGKITHAELVKLGFTADKATDAMTLLDMSGTSVDSTPEVDYGEFRTYLRSPTILIQLEKKCTEKIATQKGEIKCLYDELIKLIREEHDPIWLVVPDLDQTSAFETLDTNDDGKIKASELSEISKFANADTANRFIAEADNSGEKDVCLEEFNEYVDIPHMVYGTADCLLKTRTSATDREDCFSKEISDVIDNIKFFGKNTWKDWFNHYDTTKCGVIDSSDDIDTATGKTGLKALFLKELGQGGDTISRFEFTWYVKQQELADEYENHVTALSDSLSADQITNLNKVLVDWIENDVTEYDIEEFFSRLDKKRAGRKDHELTKEDFETHVWEKVSKLITKIDGVEPQGDADSTVNFREFWLWIHSPHADKRIKEVFKTECTVKKTSQEEELACYETVFQDPAKFGFV